MAAPKIREYKIKISQSGAEQIQRQVDGIGKSFNALKTIATAALTGVFAQKIIEIGKLAATSDRLRTSFDNLAKQEGANANQLMKDLQESTKGTVSQIELMRNATQAKFLGIDLKNLPTLFEFARRRARDTGQDVEYLVNSIVTGIGRKSPLILDNLGLQMKDIRDEVEKIAKATGTWTGKVDENLLSLHLQEAAVNIAKKGIAAAGAETNDMIDATDKLNASMENLSVALGRVINTNIVPFLTSVADAIGKVVHSMTEEGQLEKSQKRLIILTAQLAKMREEAKESTIAKIRLWFGEPNLIKNIALTKKHIQELESELQKTTPTINKINQQFNNTATEVNKAATSLFNLNRALAAMPLTEQLPIRELNNDIENLDQNFDLIEIPDLQLGPEMLNGWDIFRDKVQETSDILAYSLFQQFQEGENVFQAFGDAFVSMLERMAAEIIARAAIFGVLSFLGLGGPLGSFANFLFGGFRQHGGEVQSNQAYVVGESGPELFIPEQSGIISPTPGGNTYNITVAVPPGGDVKAFEDFLRYRGGARAVANTLPELI